MLRSIVLLVYIQNDTLVTPALVCYLQLQCQLLLISVLKNHIPYQSCGSSSLEVLLPDGSNHVSSLSHLVTKRPSLLSKALWRFQAMLGRPRFPLKTRSCHPISASNGPPITYGHLSTTASTRFYSSMSTQFCACATNLFLTTGFNGPTGMNVNTVQAAGPMTGQRLARQLLLAPASTKPKPGPMLAL